MFKESEALAANSCVILEASRHHNAIVARWNLFGVCDFYRIYKVIENIKNEKNKL